MIESEYNGGVGDAGSVVVYRGEHVESRHRVHVAVVDAGGGLVADAGDVGLLTFAAPRGAGGVDTAQGWVRRVGARMRAALAVS